MTVRRFPHHEEVMTTFATLRDTWVKAEPDHPVTVHFAAYHETFLDMARAVVDARHSLDEPPTVADATIGDFRFGLGTAVDHARYTESLHRELEPLRRWGELPLATTFSDVADTVMDTIYGYSTESSIPATMLPTLVIDALEQLRSDDNDDTRLDQLAAKERRQMDVAAGAAAADHLGADSAQRHWAGAGCDEDDRG